MAKNAYKKFCDNNFLGPYSQHLVFFATYEQNRSNKLECFSLANLSILVLRNSLAYWAGS